jgi:hypothetical protein
MLSQEPDVEKERRSAMTQTKLLRPATSLT